jgi:hypothetical protein
VAGELVALSTLEKTTVLLFFFVETLRGLGRFLRWAGLVLGSVGVVVMGCCGADLAWQGKPLSHLFYLLFSFLFLLVECPCFATV